LIIVTFLSAIILVWSSSVSTFNVQEPWSSHLTRAARPKTGSLAERTILDPESSPLLNHPVSKSTGTEQSIKIGEPSQNDSYTLSKISEKLLKRFPRIMIIGFGKAGTKALYEALKLHPQLSGPYKEKRFFSQHYSMGLETYLRSLPDPPNNGFNSEKSPDYIIAPTAPRRVKIAASVAGVSPHRLRFIVVLRDPIDRAMSEYLEWRIQRKLLNRPRLPPFEAMVINQVGNIDASQPFLNASCYAYHIDNWLKYFSNDQMCYVDGDVFVSDPLKEIQLLEECLQLEPYFSDKNFIYDKGRGFYCFQDSNSISSSVCMNKSKGRKHPNITEHIVQLLRNYFQPWNNLIPNLTGRSISWTN
jgi:[heparan sulfate]-glucosamine 3-sulfotransferase 4